MNGHAGLGVASLSWGIYLIFLYNNQEFIDGISLIAGLMTCIILGVLTTLWIMKEELK